MHCTIFFLFKKKYDILFAAADNLLSANLVFNDKRVVEKLRQGYFFY